MWQQFLDTTGRIFTVPEKVPPSIQIIFVCVHVSALKSGHEHTSPFRDAKDGFDVRIPVPNGLSQYSTTWLESAG